MKFIRQWWAARKQARRDRDERLRHFFIPE